MGKEIRGGWDEGMGMRGGDCGEGMRSGDCGERDTGTDAVEDGIWGWG